jgi:hypothetical protein
VGERLALIKMYTYNLYKTDFYAWTQEQVSLLTTQQWDQLDTSNLIEEIETLGRKERQELRNRLGNFARIFTQMAVSI